MNEKQDGRPVVCIPWGMDTARAERAGSAGGTVAGSKARWLDGR